MQAWGRWFLQNLSHLQWQTEHPIRFLGRWASNETALSKKISVNQLNTSLLFFRMARVIALLIKPKTPTPPPFPPKNLPCIPQWFNTGTMKYRFKQNFFHCLIMVFSSSYFWSSEFEKKIPKILCTGVLFIYNKLTCLHEIIHRRIPCALYFVKFPVEIGIVLLPEEFSRHVSTIKTPIANTTHYSA